MRHRTLTILALSAWLTGCGSSAHTTASAPPSGGSTLSAAAQLGAQIFVDKELSVSGQQSCSTCHVAKFAFTADPSLTGPDHGAPVALGGPNMDLAGFRNTPSLMYLSYTPEFFFDSDGGPNGGFFRDGRAATLALQGQEPFITSFEMANADAAAVLEKLKTRPYFTQFIALYGETASNDPDTALQRVGAALAAFQTEDPRFHPFTSKFDYWRRGAAQFTAQEVRGFGLFNNPTKGNCSACHPSTSADGITPPLFTDFSYDNLGIPRNIDIAANLDDGTAPPYTPLNGDDGLHNFYDLGICGPLRLEPGTKSGGICGQFKVPTLRNIALTAPYFHNGEFSSLVKAVGFYVQRDTNPDKFYPTQSDGTVTKFDDLPASFGGQFRVNLHDASTSFGYLGNVNTGEIPYNRTLGDLPALNPDEINDVIAFLCTLTDGYDPSNPNALVLPAQCLDAVSAD